MVETIAFGGFRREVLDLLLQPIETVYNQMGYTNYCYTFPNSDVYKKIVTPVLVMEYPMLSEEDITSLCDVFFNFINPYLREYRDRNRFLDIDDFARLEIFRMVITNGVNSTLCLLERKVLESYGVTNL